MKRPMIVLFSVLFIAAMVFVNVHHSFDETSVTEDVALAFFENNLEAYADEHGCDGNTADCVDGITYCYQVEPEAQQWCSEWKRCGTCDDVMIYDSQVQTEDGCCFPY